MMKAYEQVCMKCTPWAMTFLRIVLGLILINHGWGKLFGDTAPVIAFFETTVLPAPAAMVMLAGIIETVGGALLILGLFTRLVATIVSLEFVVIILFVKLQGVIEMMKLNSMELDLLILATALALSSLGAGAISADNLFKGRRVADTHDTHGPEAITG